MKTRVNLFHIIVGTRGTGKSYFTRELNKKREKVLYIMAVDHQAFRHLQTITIADLKRWKKGHKRIVGFPTTELFEALDTLVSNCTICFEDATQYTDYRLGKGLLPIVINSKQRNNDIQMQFHSLRRVPSDVYDNADYMTIFKTKDIPGKDRKVPPHVWPAWNKVKTDKNPYANITIQME